MPLTITIANNIRIRGAGTPLRAKITADLTVPNPEYEEKKAKKRPLWGTEKYLRLYSLAGTDIIAPRGYLRDLTQIPEIQDTSKTTFSSAYTLLPEIDFGAWNPKYALRPDQQEAIEALKDAESGVLVAPAGSGKTVMGMRLIQEIGQPTLWLTHTKDLLYQSRDKAVELLASVGKVGIFGDGKHEWGDGKLFLATVQTLGDNPKLVGQLNQLVGNVIVDECLASGTQIALSDGTLKPIEEICNGDKVVGGYVSNVFKKKAETFSVVTQSGELICTDTHTHMAIPKKLIKSSTSHTTLNPSSSDIREIITRDLSPGDYLLVPCSLPHTEISSWAPAQLAFVAMIITDGHIEQQGNRVKVAVRKDMDYYRAAFREGLASFGCETSYKESINSRGDLTVWSNDRNLIRILTTIFLIPCGKKSSKVVVAPTIMQAPLKSIATFLNAVFSIEGTVSACHCNRLILDMTSKMFIRQMQFLLKKFQIHSWFLRRKRTTERHNDIFRLTLGGQDLERFQRIIGPLVNPRKAELLQRRQRNVKKATTCRVVYENQEYILVKVKQIQHKGDNDVYDFTTSAHTFIANNHLTHNCHHVPASSFLNVIGQFSPFYMYGLTATDKRKDKLEIYMYRAIGPVVHEIPRDGLYDTGRLIKPEIKFVFTGFDYEQAADINDLGSVDAGGEDLDYRVLMDRLVADEARAKLVAENILEHAKSFSIVITESVRYCHVLADMVARFAKAGWGVIPRIAMVHGSISRYKWIVGGTEKNARQLVVAGDALEFRRNERLKRWEVKVEQYSESEFKNWQVSNAERKQRIADCRDGKVDILFATAQLVQEGLDLPNLCCGHLAMPKRGDTGGSKNGASVEQAIGRLMRPDPNTPDKKAIWFDYVDYNVGVLRSQYYSRRSVYKRLGLKVPGKPKTAERDEIESFLDTMPW